MGSIQNEGDALFIEKDGKKIPLEIPPEGMIGLIAYGDIGLCAWRNAKKKVYDQRMKDNELKGAGSEQQ